MGNTDAQDQEQIMEDEFHGLENSLSLKPTPLCLSILLVQRNGFQSALISPLNHHHIDSLLFFFFFEKVLKR